MKKIVLFYLLFVNGVLLSQNPHYFTIDKTKGLPSNTVYDIVQDKKGMIWLATNEGICKFDGKKFTPFSSDEQKSRAGSNLIEDMYGRIWYCSFDGYIYYVQNGKIYALPQQNALGYQKFNILDNQLLYFEENNIVFLDLKTLKQNKKVSFKSNDLIASHLFKGIFYVYTKDFLLEVSPNGKLKKILLPTNIKENLNTVILTNSSDKLVLLSKYSNKYSLYSNGTFKEFDFEKKIIFLQNASFTSNTNWISTTNGIVKFNINHPSNCKRYFENYNISVILKDNEDNHWIGTLGKGLLLIPNFETYLIPTQNGVSKIIPHKNKLLYSTQNDKIFSSLDSKNAFDFQEIFNGNSNHTIEQFELDTLHQKIYFTSNSFKTASIDGKLSSELLFAMKELTKIDDQYYGFAASGICGIYKAGKGKSEWNNRFTKGVKHEQDDHIAGLIANVRGKSVAYNDETKTIYYATNIGLFAVNATKKDIILWKKKPLNLSKIVFYNKMIYGLTTTNKLLVIDQNNVVKPILFPIEDNTIQKIKLIKSSLYLFTNNSIIKYNLDKNIFNKVFNRNADNEITDIIEFQNSYLLASSKGIICVNINDNKKTCIPKFIIENVFVNGKKMPIKNLDNLTSKENSIDILYSVISFVPNLNKVLYYKINSGNWQTTDDQSRILKLSSLSSGNYKIHFKTAHNNRYSEITSLSIYIKKPFIESIWFYILTAAIVIVFINFFYRREIKKIKKRNQLLIEKMELEKNLNQSTLKAIKSQMNPHFFYNALNTIQSYILANDKKQAVNYLSKFSSLTRTILEMSEKETISVAEEIQTLSFYLDIEKARFDEDFEYSINTPENFDADQYKIPSLLLQPYVENSIKHGLLHKIGAKNLTISFEVKKDTLIITIKDNGIGRKKSEELKKLRKNPHQSFATEAMEQKIQLLNKNKTNKITLEIIDEHTEQNNAKGTAVIFKIPLDFNYK